MDIDGLMGKGLDSAQFPSGTHTDDVVLNVQLLMCKRQFYQALKLCGESQISSATQE